MNSTSPGAGPSLIGTVVDTARFDVERGKIREFARATGAALPSCRQGSVTLVPGGQRVVPSIGERF